MKQALHIYFGLSLVILCLVACSGQNAPTQADSASESHPAIPSAPVATEIDQPAASTSEAEAGSVPDQFTDTSVPPETEPVTPSEPAADLPGPPDHPVRLIFIHHSTGGNWLADPAGNELGGDLGRLLMQNKYFVSATNYGWGPDSIGDNTDIGLWWDWFRGPQNERYLNALYSENEPNFGDFGTWPRLGSDPGGENEIVLFKSCFPNSHLGGSPIDPPTVGDNPMRGAFAGDDSIYTVGNAKGIYNDILEYFASRQDKLFIVITAPPLAEWETDASHAANARALNDWLVNEWLSGYPYSNVAVYDFYNVLTSNAGDANTNDLGMEGGNHHRWWNGAIQHVQTVQNNFSAYPSGDSHPSRAGNQKAAEEFVQLLNVYYHRWAEGESLALAPAPSITPESEPTAIETLATPLPLSGELVQPADIAYLGAFRLPGDGDRPYTFAYGGSAMTYNPAGDPAGAADGFPGSIFITGHDRLPYGELPNGSQIAEVTIPQPVIAVSPSDLNQADFIQNFTDVFQGYFTELAELPRIGLQYLDTPAIGPRIHITWGQHLQPDQPVASQAWFNPDLSAPDVQGTWFIGDQSLYSVNGYMLEIPAGWADRYTQGRYLGTGRYKDGGWSGMGPALFAYRPWVDDSGSPAASGTHLEATTLLHYASSQDTDIIEQCLDGYQHPDEWEGGAWLTTPTGKSALLFAGTKSVGDKYWYGFVNPSGPDQPCVYQDFVGQFTVCRLADGSPCPAADFTECQGHNDYRGWWTTRWEAQFILYDPSQLARVAAGEIASWEPQPYTTINIDQYLFLNPSGVDPDMLGTGSQRRYRIGEISYDRANGLLYVLELFADEARPVVHVWRIAP